MRCRSALLAAALAVASSAADQDQEQGQDQEQEPPWPAPGGPVIELTTDFFKAIVKTHELTILMFHAADCSHCEAMKPAFTEAATQLSDHQPPIAFGSIYARQNAWLRSKFGVKAYPSLFTITSGGEDADFKAARYAGNRSAAGLTAYMLEEQRAMVAGEKPQHDFEAYHPEKVAAMKAKHGDSYEASARDVAGNGATQSAEGSVADAVRAGNYGAALNNAAAGGGRHTDRRGGEAELEAERIKEDRRSGCCCCCCWGRQRRQRQQAGRRAD
eukprot:SAG22_NODE_276_length_13167_cov_8.415825_16_plen_272_part_00